LPENRMLVDKMGEIPKNTQTKWRGNPYHCLN